jgi:hypothetical protein
VKVWGKSSKNEMKWSELNCGEDVKGALSVVKWNEGKIMVNVSASVHGIKYFITVTVYCITYLL